MLVAGTIAYALGYTRVGDTAGTGPMPVVPRFGDNIGLGYVDAAGNPLFQSNSHELAPGRDELKATPSRGKLTGKTVSVSFTVG